MDLGIQKYQEKEGIRISKINCVYIAKSLSKLIFRKVKLLPKQSGKEKRSLVAEIIAITVTHKHTLKQTNKETPTAITMNMNEEVVFLE